MQGQDAVINELWAATAILQFTVCVRLAVKGLLRAYPRFFFFLSALALETCVLMPLTHNVPLYRRCWVVSRAILLTLQLAAVFEIFSRWAASFPGIGRFGKVLMVVLFAGATLIALSSSVSVPWSSAGWKFAIFVMVIANQIVQFGLASFLVLMLGFFLKFGGPVAPNLKRHTWAMTAFLTANALSYLVVNARDYWWGSVSLQAVSTGAIVYWLFALRTDGEKPQLPPDNPERWAEAEKMNNQLLDFAKSVKKPQQEREIEKKR